MHGFEKFGEIMFGFFFSAAIALGFGVILARALKTGVMPNHHGDIRRDEKPILYWMGIAMLLGWVVGLPVFVMLFVIGVIVP